MRKICVITGTRAEYGLLCPVLKEIQGHKDLHLQIIATGMHLSPEFGLTYRAIESDGFVIHEKVEMLLSSDTPVGITKSVGLGVIGFADAYVKLQPDIIVLLGDRFEMLAAVQAALFAKIPVAHLCGGDTTEGAFDESIRHSITKMSHFHYVTNDLARKRVCQLGEDPNNVMNYGSTGIDVIKNTRLLSRDALERELEFIFREKNLLITFHPVTLDNNSSADQFHELLMALDDLGPDVGLIFTRPNADTGGRRLSGMIDEFVATHANSRVYVSLGQLKYLSVMSQVNAVVGNSSSGLYEAPSFKIPSVNIGDRQKGRLQSESVVNCEVRRDSILLAIQQAFLLDCSAVENPYGDGGAAKMIVNHLSRADINEALLKKHFFDMV